MSALNEARRAAENGVMVVVTVLAIAVAAWLGLRLIDGLRAKTPDGCFYVVRVADSFPPELCVTMRHLGDRLSTSEYERAKRETPSLFCGGDMEAAEWVQRAGGRICGQTTVSHP